MAHRGKTGQLLVSLPKVDFKGPAADWARALTRQLERILRKGTPGSVAHLDQHGKVPPSLLGGDVDQLYDATDFVDE